MDNILIPKNPQEFIKHDGSTPFTNPQAGVDPIQEYHLTTKRFVKQLIADVLGSIKPLDTEELITKALDDYVKATKVFTKNETYSKDKIDELFNQYVRRDGTKSFTLNQQGIHPSSDYDITTKKYVDDLIYGYMSDSDLDNFKLYVNNALNAKVKTSDVYKKSETYSKAQLNFTLQALVVDAAKEAINEHIKDSYHLSTDDIDTYLEQYIKKSDNQFVTLTALNKILSHYQGSGAVANNYLSHGPTLSDPVGFIGTGRELPESISYQDLFDIIFYDSDIDVIVNKPYVEKGVESTVCVDITVTGITDFVKAELYLNDQLHGTYDYALFDEGKLTVCDLPVNTDTAIKVVVYYPNADIKEEVVNLYAVAPIYVGLLPKWLPASNLTYDILQKLINGDLIDVEEFNEPIYGDPLNNWKLIKPVEPVDILVHNEFVYDGISRHPFIMYPKYPHPVVGTAAQLYEMDSSVQAFPVVGQITDIPIELPNRFEEIYTIFVYDLAVTSLDTDITYKFKL